MVSVYSDLDDPPKHFQRQDREGIYTTGAFRRETCFLLSFVYLRMPDIE
jgi:hypothetical protein